jgi:hypothetical protein
MSQPPPPAELPGALPHVWSALPADLQQRAVRLLTRLAFAQFRQSARLSTQETNHGHTTQHGQDSARPS